ncbi:MAG: Ig-like domain-containing protein, partial [Bifidobacteriaceae bacterium]|nr:Ig-like domain-containing protein [Bifidobacteriaceae bacterium]
MRRTRSLAMVAGAGLVATLAVGGGFPSVPEAVADPGWTYAEAITNSWDFEPSAVPSASTYFEWVTDAGKAGYSSGQTFEVVADTVDNATHGNVMHLSKGTYCYYVRSKAKFGDFVAEFDYRGVDTRFLLRMADTRTSNGTAPGQYAQPSETGYIIEITDTTVAINVDRDTSLSSSTPAATIPSRGTAWHHFKVVSSGSLIEVYYDGATTPLVQKTDAESRAGRVAFSNSSTGTEAWFDNFQLTETAAPYVAYSNDFESADDAELMRTSSPGTSSANYMGANTNSGFETDTVDPATYGTVYKIKNNNDTSSSWEANQPYYRPIPLDLTAYTIAFDLRYQAGGNGPGEATVMLYGVETNPDAGMPLVLGDTDITLKSDMSNAATTLATATVAARGTGWAHYEIAVNGNNVKVYLNGNATPVIDETVTVPATYGKGFSFYGWRHTIWLDNLEITNPDTTTKAISVNFEATEPLHNLIKNTDSVFTVNMVSETATPPVAHDGDAWHLRSGNFTGACCSTAQMNNMAYKAGFESSIELLNYELKFDLLSYADVPSHADAASQNYPIIMFRGNVNPLDSGWELRIQQDQLYFTESYNEDGNPSYVPIVATKADTRDMAWHTWRLVLEGDTLKIWKDDMTTVFWEITDLPDSKWVGGGGFSFKGWRHEVYIDNLSIKAWGVDPDVAFTLNRATSDITVGDYTTLSPVYDQIADKADGFVWTSSDTSVATVDQYGVVAGVGAGTATITATSTGYGPQSASATVNVKAATSGLYLYVSPDGDDATGAGTATSPFKTVQGARDYIRTLDRPLPAGGVTVYLARAWYYTDEAITFEPEDSGEPGAPIVYTTEPGAAAAGEPNQATIHSGRAVTGWRALNASDNPLGMPDSAKPYVLVADVEAGWTPRDLYVEYTDGQPAERQQVARQTNSSIITTWHVFPKSDATIDMRVQRILNDGATKGMEIPFVTGDLVNVPSNGDAEVVFSPEVWNQSVAVLKDVQLGGTDYLPGYQTARLEFYSTPVTPGYNLGSSIFSPYGGGAGGYNIQNAPKFLDQAGEWCIDSAAGKIYWWPKGNLTAAQVNGDRTTPILGVFAPHATSLLDLLGQDDATSANKVEYLEFRNLAFMYSDRIPEDSWDDNPTQPMVGGYEDPNSMVNLIGTDHVTLAQNVFAHSGNGGITLKHYAQNTLIFHNEIFDLNSTALTVSGYKPSATMHVNNYNVILGNSIKNVGRLYGHAPGVTINGASYTDFKFNHVDGTPYNAITVGGDDPTYFQPSADYAASDCTTNALSYFNSYGGCVGLRDNGEWADLLANADRDVWKTYPSSDWCGSGESNGRNCRAMALQQYHGNDYNIVEYNIADNYGQTLSDGGAYYTWSGGKNNEFNYNIAHKDGGNAAMWVNGLYADDMSIFSRWTNNVVYSNDAACVGPVSPCTRNQTGIGIVWKNNTVSKTEPAAYAPLRSTINDQLTAFGGEPSNWVNDHIPNSIPTSGLLLDVTFDESGPVDAQGHAFSYVGSATA